MRYFALLDFQHLILAVFSGLLALVFAAAAWGGYPRREGDVPAAPEPEATPEAQDHPAPPLLVLVYAGVVAGALGYAVFSGLLGGPVGY